MRLIMESWRRYLYDPAEAVNEALIELGAKEEGTFLNGPPPIKSVALSTQNDTIWIHWIEGERPGAGAWKYLSKIISQVAPNTPIALEANFEAAPFWEKQGFEEIDQQEAEEIYPNIEVDNRFFLKDYP